MPKEKKRGKNKYTKIVLKQNWLNDTATGEQLAYSTGQSMKFLAQINLIGSVLRAALKFNFNCPAELAVSHGFKQRFMAKSAEIRQPKKQKCKLFVCLFVALFVYSSDALKTINILCPISGNRRCLSNRATICCWLTFNLMVSQEQSIKQLLQCWPTTNCYEIWPKAASELITNCWLIKFQ